MLLAMFSCGNSPSRPETVLNETQQNNPTDVGASTEANPLAVTPPPKEPAQNAEGVWHYTCPTGCEGGGGSATPCAKCGTTLVHNSAYHGGGAGQATPPIGITNGDGQTQTITTTAGGVPTNLPIQVGGPGELPGGVQQVPPPTAEPPQNASGVWHFELFSFGCSRIKTHIGSKISAY